MITIFLIIWWAWLKPAHDNTFLCRGRHRLSHPTYNWGQTAAPFDERVPWWVNTSVRGTQWPVDFELKRPVLTIVLGLGSGTAGTANWKSRTINRYIEQGAKQTNATLHLQCSTIVAELFAVKIQQIWFFWKLLFCNLTDCYFRVI